jgi:ankyrin repeat protein
MGAAKNGWTPLMAAATFDDHTTAALLLEARANPDARDVVGGGTRSKHRMKGARQRW